MPASIVFNQVTNPTPGVAGKARDDFDVALEVTCSNATAETSYTWTLVDVPIRSALLRGTVGTNSSFKFTPDVKGTYLVSLRVNSSSLISDNAVSFAAVRSSTTTGMGWRYLAAGEERIDNIVKTGLNFPSNLNTRGWATERDLQLEETEATVKDVADAVVVSPGAGSPNSLVRIDGVTGQIDPTLIPGSTPGASVGIKYHLVVGDNITVPADYQYLVAGAVIIDPLATLTLAPGAQLVIL